MKTTQIWQTCLSGGFGGLEMVVLDFHHWMIRQGVDARLRVRHGTRLHQKMLETHQENRMVALPDGPGKLWSDRWSYKASDGKNVGHLFHEQKTLKGLLGIDLKGSVTLLSHTFYGVKKSDWFHQRTFKKIDRWVSLTPRHRQNIIDTMAFDPERIWVIPNGVNLQRFQRRGENAAKDRSAIHIGVVARLDPQKGQDLALKALQLLKKDYPGVTLHFFGEDTPEMKPFKPVLIDMAEQLGLSAHVRFEGLIEDLESRLSAMDLVWMPSHNETFGRCIIESMACGVPVIASNAGGVPDIIQDGINGILFETMNADALARKTQSLLARPDLMSQLRQQALKDVAATYDQDVVFRRLYEVVAPPQ